MASSIDVSDTASSQDATPRSTRTTRQRTQAQIFASLQPPWSSLREAQRTVGRKVNVYWGGDKRWYCGRIVLVHPTSRQVFVKYEDHEERWHAMWEEEYQWVDEEEAAAATSRVAVARRSYTRVDHEEEVAASSRSKRIGPRRAVVVD